jgi:hypothetical protein
MKLDFKKVITVPNVKFNMEPLSYYLEQGGIQRTVISQPLVSRNGYEMEDFEYAICDVRAGVRKANQKSGSYYIDLVKFVNHTCNNIAHNGKGGETCIISTGVFVRADGTIRLEQGTSGNHIKYYIGKWEDLLFLNNLNSLNI